MKYEITQTDKLLRDVMYPVEAEEKSFRMCISVSDIDTKTITEKAIDIMQHVTPALHFTCLAADYARGDCRQYLSSIVSMEDISRLHLGESALMFCPTGSGKTKTLENITFAMEQEVDVIYLTNRSACETQVRKDLLSRQGYPSVPQELIGKITIAKNIDVMTYQKFAQNINQYHGKRMLLMLDEVHCLSEDAVFSTYPQKIVNFLKRNLDNTIRIYITATESDVLNTVLHMENLSETEQYGAISPDITIQELHYLTWKTTTRIRRVYCMDTDWSYLNFQFYNPNEKEKLVAFIKTANENHSKALIYINDILKGKEMQQELGECQHVYSDADKKVELDQIAIDEKFQTNNLVTTKVAENGLSLHDDKLDLIVVETWDLITLQQMIGRARVNRKSPRSITVLVPDYNVSDIGAMEGKLYTQLAKVKNVMDNPAYSLEFAEVNNPYVYYSAIARKPVVNEMAYLTLTRQYEFLRALKLEESIRPHAFARKVLELYGFSAEIHDSMFLDYNNISDCKKRIAFAWDTYKASDKSESALKELKKQLKAACNETGAYGKDLDSNIQIGTVNDILKFAGIKEQILPKRTVYDFTEST